jgi:glycosyltransferase involved in cell wall biosynthesis
MMNPVRLDPLNENPLISVLIPNYNYAVYIGQAIESVLSQSYQTFEIIVCDNGSTDHSYQIIKEYARQDKRIIATQQERRGIAAALNTAYANSRGAIICLLDADDLYHSHKFERILSGFRDNPSSGLCVHTLQPISANQREIGNPFPIAMKGGWLAPEALSNGGAVTMLPPSSALSFRREISDAIFPLPEDIPRGMDLYLTRTAQFLTAIVILDEVLTKYRIHGQNLSGIAFPDSSNISKVMDNFVAVTDEIKSFLQNRFGDEVSSQLLLEDNPLYKNLVLALYTLEGRPKEGIYGYTPEVIMEGINKATSSRMWRLLYALPSKPARILFKLWWGKYPMKRVIGKARRIVARRNRC